MEKKDEKSKPEYTQEQLNTMDYKRLRQVTLDAGLSPVGQDLKGLKMLLGAGPKNATVLDNSEGMSSEEMTKLYNEQKRVPQKTVYWDKDDEAFWKMREKNPEAFDNTDMTDKSAKSQHVFSKKVKCHCGEKFKIERVYKKTRDGRPVMVIDKAPMDYKPCPKCGRMYYYHDSEKDVEIFAP